MSQETESAPGSAGAAPGHGVQAAIALAFPVGVAQSMSQCLVALPSFHSVLPDVTRAVTLVAPLIAERNGAPPVVMTSAAARLSVMNLILFGAKSRS